MIREDRDNELLAILSLQITSQSFSVHNILFVQQIAGDVSSRFRTQSAGGRRISLRVPQSSVASEDRKSIVVVAKVFLRRHERKKFDHEIRCEISTSSGAV
jgi:hypothetical protein